MSLGSSVILPVLSLARYLFFKTTMAFSEKVGSFSSSLLRIEGDRLSTDLFLILFDMCSVTLVFYVVLMKGDMRHIIEIYTRPLQ